MWRLYWTCEPFFSLHSWDDFELKLFIYNLHFTQYSKQSADQIKHVRGCAYGNLDTALFYIKNLGIYTFVAL